jgi:prepilin-type N-terminal cleavage/methylation domain-containing protein
MWLRSSADRRRPAAFTLLEVLIGMVLLSTLAVVTLQGFRSHKLQLKFSENRLVAVAELERLLAVWSSSDNGIPELGIGPVSPTSPWVWRIHIREQREIFGQPARVVRVEIFESAHPTARRLCFLDLLRRADS